MSPGAVEAARLVVFELAADPVVAVVGLPAQRRVAGVDPDALDLCIRNAAPPHSGARGPDKPTYSASPGWGTAESRRPGPPWSDSLWSRKPPPSGLAAQR